MSENTVLVTGAGGFIGSWVLRELLNTGRRVVALDLRPAPERWSRILGSRARDVVFSDVALTDRDGLESLFRKHAVSHVIHLAALLTPDCQRDPFLGCQVNVLGSTAVFDAARRSGKVQAISFASSYAVYGEEGADETEPPMFYGAFKQAVDAIANQYWRHFGLRSLAIRPHVVYGPERELGLTAGPSLACRAAVRGEHYEIGYTGPAGYDYVEDVARAFVSGVFHCPGGATVADLPSERATTQQIVTMIEQAVPASRGRITVSGPPIPSNIPPTLRDIRKILSDWQPTELAKGIEKTTAFYRHPGAGA